MNHYHWCGICERTAVQRAGETCVRCRVAIEAICYPNDRIEGVWRQRPWGVRLLNWLTARP